MTLTKFHHLWSSIVGIGDSWYFANRHWKGHITMGLCAECFLFFCFSLVTGRWWTSHVQVQVQALPWTSASLGSVKATWWRGGNTHSKAGTRWVWRHSDPAEVLTDLKEALELETRCKLKLRLEKWKFCVKICLGAEWLLRFVEETGSFNWNNRNSLNYLHLGLCSYNILWSNFTFVIFYQQNLYF